MNTRFLAPLAWTFRGLLVLIVIFGLVRVSTERTTSPEAGRGLGVMFMVALLIVVAIVGILLYIAIKKQSPWGLGIMALLVAYPIVVLIAIPVVSWYKTYRFEAEYARVGDFPDDALKPLAAAIAANDTAALTTLLAGKLRRQGMTAPGTTCWRIRWFQCAPDKVTSPQCGSCSKRAPIRVRR